VRIPDLLARRADLRPEAIALVEAGSGLRRTYREVHDRADRCAGFLRDEWQISSGDRVAVLAHNTVDLFDLLFACARLGAILVPLNWRLATEELAAIVADCRPGGLVFGAEFAGPADELADRFGGRLAVFGAAPVEPADTSFESALAAADPGGGGYGPYDDASAWYLLYTSGTTGRPKGVICTPGMVLANHVNIGTAIDLTAADTSLNLLPQFHTGGINLFALPTLIAGGTAVVQRAFRAEQTLTLLAGGVTAIFAVPTVYHELAQHPDFAGTDLSGVRVWGSGGAPMPRRLVEIYAERGIRVRQGCGMTETGPTVFFQDADRAVDKAGSVGRPQVLVEARAVDRRGREVPIGETGEVLVRGPAVTPGYWQRPDATEAAFTADGWLRTGDVGLRDADGDWYIVDRVKDMYISGGENVYPGEVERVLEEHPSVLEVAVVGVPDERWGEVGAAAVRPNPSAAPPAPDDVRAWCRERLAGYKVPRHVIVVDELPRNATGKVVKPKLREQLQECLTTGDLNTGVAQ
jgi:fatty-acyl-CoA synthase